MNHILIVGPPCALCEETTKRVRLISRVRGLDCTVERLSDFDATLALGVYAIPGLLVDGVLKSVGRVPEAAELADWLDPGRC
jgi:small redox-active disulfide protein 2